MDQCADGPSEPFGAVPLWNILDSEEYKMNETYKQRTSVLRRMTKKFNIQKLNIIPTTPINENTKELIKCKNDANYFLKKYIKGK